MRETRRECRKFLGAWSAGGAGRFKASISFWSWRAELNRGPAHYECAALPAELRQLRMTYFIYSQGLAQCFFSPMLDLSGECCYS